MRAETEISAFAKGEVSPRLKGRTDYKGYFDAAESILNMVVLPQGGVTRRPGTIFANYIKDQAHAPHIWGFQFKQSDSYMLEFGDQSIRFYRDQQLVVNNLAIVGSADNGSGEIRLQVNSTEGLYDGNTVTVTDAGEGIDGVFLIDVIDSTHFDLVDSVFDIVATSGNAEVIVEVPTTYTFEEVRALGFTQSADQMFITHPLHPPAVLSRFSHTHWTLEDIPFKDGPYFPVNSTTTTFAITNITGATTVTASATEGINDGEGFKSTDVGRSIRFFGTKWAWLVIDSVTDSTHVEATIQPDVTNGSEAPGAGVATTKWRMGKWSVTTGWPWLTTFWQQRLGFFGTNNQPNALELSATGDFYTFSPTKGDATVVDTNALSWVMSDDQVNAVRWVSAAGSARNMQLGIGTEGSEHLLQAASAALALTPTSVQAYRETTIGAVSYASALRIGKSVLFASASGRRMHKWEFNWQVDGYQGPDLTVDSEHLTVGIIKDIAYQKNPLGIVWVVLEDGGLIGLTYLPEQNISAWHRHRLGGNYYDGPPLVESIAVKPSDDGTADELWLAVVRTLNGEVRRTMEVMSPFFDDQNQEEAIFMDLCLPSNVDCPVGVIQASSTTGAVTFTATSGTPFSTSIVGAWLRYQGGTALIETRNSSTLVGGTWLYDARNTAPAGTHEWTVALQGKRWDGAEHLAGETIQALGDGADMGLIEVAADGTFTLPAPASYLVAGLPTEYELILMPSESERPLPATMQGKARTTAKLYLRMLRSLGCNIGRKMTDPTTDRITYPSEPLKTRSAADRVGLPPPLYSGIRRLSLKGGHDLEGQIRIDGNGPMPCTILSLIAVSDVGDMPGGG